MRILNILFLFLTSILLLQCCSTRETQKQYHVQHDHYNVNYDTLSEPKSGYNPESVYVDSEIIPYLKEFYQSCGYYDYDTCNILLLDEIVLADLGEIGNKNVLLGVCITKEDENGIKRGRILMSRQLYELDSFLFKFVLYHEIGHWMGKGHLLRMTDMTALMSKNGYVDLNEILGIMMPHIDVSMADFLEENWSFMRHNFFVRDMKEEDRLPYTYKLFDDEMQLTLDKKQFEANQICMSENCSEDSLAVIHEEIDYILDMKVKIRPHLTGLLSLNYLWND